MQRVPGTGSSRVGYSFTVIEENGKSGTAGHAKIPHSNFDFYEMRPPQKCDALPFKLVEDLGRGAIPVLIYLPRKFDTSTLKGEVSASDLPDGTVVVYAALKRPE